MEQDPVVVSPWQHGLPGPLAQHLPPLDVVRLACVCRAWREELSHAVLAERLTTSSNCWRHGHRAASAVAWLTRNLHRVRHLEVHWGGGDDLPLDLLTAAPANGLKRLKFGRYCIQLPSLASCTALQELCLQGSIDSTELPPLDALVRLTRLEVGGLRNSHDSQSVELLINKLRSCTALKALAFDSDCLNMSAFPRVYLPQLAPKLTSLKLRRCCVSTLPCLDSFPSSLRELELVDCVLSASENLHSLTACRELASLWITAVPAGVCIVDSLPPLTSLPSLRSLRIESSAGFPSLLGLSRLTQLKVRNCCTADLAQVPTLTSLVELFIGNAPNLKELPSLASCVQLRILSIYHCPALRSLPDLSCCTRLEELSITRCRHVRQLPDLRACVALERVYFYK